MIAGVRTRWRSSVARVNVVRGSDSFHAAARPHFRRSFRALVATAALVGVLLLAWDAAPARAASTPAGAAAWPVPVPQWFWTWARWYLGRREFAEQPPQDPAARPGSAPSFVPQWAWRRLIVLVGGTPPPLPDATLRIGDRGGAIERLQRALRSARYAVGPIDGRFGPRTEDAVIAWEKIHDSRRDGTVSRQEYLRIIRSLRPQPPVAAREDYDYVDLDRQVVIEVRGGLTRHVLPVSSGGGYTYRGRDGTPHVATTPPGTFHVFRKVRGLDESYLGLLWNPNYFNGGIAIHGERSVPVHAASHGCVRIPKWASLAFYLRTPIGTTVIVR
jgi:hypothetical protein